MNGQSTPAITARTLAEFMVAPPSTQRRIVTTAKYPKEVESKAILSYYREARRIAELRLMPGGLTRLRSELAALEGLAAKASGSRHARLSSNIRAVRDFEVLEFARQSVQVFKSAALLIQLGKVELKVQPSLQFLNESQCPTWCQLDFCEDAPDEQKAAITTQLFLRAARDSNIELPPRDAQYLHVHTGQCFAGQRHRARLERQILASCDTFADIWNSI